MFVEIVMIAHVQADNIYRTPLCTDGEQCRLVLVHALAIAEFVDGRNFTGLVHGRLVLHTHLRLELVLCCHVEPAKLIVNTQNRRNADSALVAKQIHTLRIFLQTVQALLRTFELGLLCHQSLRSRHTHRLILGNARVDLPQSGIYLRLCTAEETAEVYISVTLCTHLDVADFCLIGSTAVEQSQTTIDREILCNLVCATQLHAEIILAALHVSVHVVASCAERCQLMGNVADNTFKRAEAIAKLTLSATARHREIELETPVAFVIGSLQRGNARSVGHTLKHLHRCTVVLAPQSKQRIVRRDGTRLVGILPVDTEMKTFGKENHTSRV